MRTTVLIGLLFFVLFAGGAYGQSVTSARKFLIGNWTSVDDGRYRMVVTSDQFQESYDGESQDVFSYTVSEQSCAAEGGNSMISGTAADVYLKKFKTDEVYCYQIIEINAKRLSLIYLPRGNTLRFVRTRTAKKHR